MRVGKGGRFTAESGRRAPINEVHEDLREATREVCRSFLDEYSRARDEEREYPEAFVRAMTGSGLLGALIPEEYGGMGLGLQAACAILEEVNRNNGANAGPAHAQMYTMGTLLRHGSKAQKEEYLPKIASGELRLQAFGVTEPEAGTRRGREALPRPLRLSRGPARSRRRRAHRKRRRVMMNNETNELLFEHLRVPAGSIIGEEGKGFGYIMDGMNAERILIAAECVGDGRFFVERATDRAKKREVFGRPIGQNQGIQFPIAKSHVSVEAADLMTEKAAALFDANEPCGAEANMAKLLAADASWEAANVAVQTFGGCGFDAEYDIERKFRETRLYQVAPISTNLILSYVAEHVLELPRSF